MTAVSAEHTKALSLATLEAAFLSLPQAACPVAHHFGPGLYVREVSIPANTLAIGHLQKREHLNIMLKGRVAIINEGGGVSELQAPLIFTGQPGRKVGYVLEDMVWLNVYPTEETDIDTLEATYLDKSEVWQAIEQQRHVTDHASHEVDRIDYHRLLAEVGILHEIAREQSENLSDQLDMPAGWAPVRVLPSPIEGLGLFVSAPVEAGQVIAPARIAGLRTPAGRYTNHSQTPNAYMCKSNDGDIDLVALRDIDGCRGGQSGEEITIDYRQALSLSGVRTLKEAA